MEIRFRTNKLTLNLGLAIADGKANLMVLVGDEDFVRVIDICTVSFKENQITKETLAFFVSYGELCIVFAKKQNLHLFC